MAQTILVVDDDPVQRRLLETAITSDAAKHIRLHPRLDGLDVSRTSFGDAGVEQLTALNRLSSFSGGGTPITDRGAQSLSRMKSLTRVTLYGTPITDAAIGYLSQLPLERLSVEVTRITDAAMKDLQDCKTLRYLNIRETAISDPGLSLIASLPLQTLWLRDTHITDRSVETLAGMKSLTKLTLSDPPISHAGFEKLKEALPNCDIDWSPSKAPAVAAVPAAPVVARKAADQPAATDQQPATADGKLPIPNAEGQRGALKLIKELYKDEYAHAKQPEAKAALAEKLLNESQQTKDDATALYCVLQEARELAVEAASPALAERAIGMLAGHFAVEPLQELAASLDQMAGKPHPADVNRKIAEMSLGRIEEALAADDFDTAKQLADTALAAGRKAKDAALTKRVVEAGKTVGSAKQQWEAWKKAERALAQSPDDPAANLAVGRHFAFVQGDWERGLAHLAKGPDGPLKDLSAKGLKPPTEPAALAEMGDAWFAAAEKAKGKDKADLRAGAAYWYSLAEPGLTGLAKTIVEKRLKDLGGKVTVAQPGSAGKLPETIELPLAPGVGMKFRLIPAGTFMMGAHGAQGGNERSHQVNITRPFYFGITEVPKPNGW